MYQGCIYKLYFQRPIFIYGVHILLGIHITSLTGAGSGITNALLGFSRRILIDGKRIFMQHKLQQKTGARASIYPIIPIISIVDKAITDKTEYLGLVYRLYRLFAYK